MLIRFKNQLNAVGILTGHDRQPAVRPQGNIGLLLKPKNVCVKLQRLFLVIDQDACENNLHEPPAFCSGSSQRFTTARTNGVVSRKWNLYRPSRRVVISPAASSTARCWETACRVSDKLCF